MNKPSDLAINEGVTTAYEWRDVTTVVNRLRVRSSRPDSVQARRAEGMLDSASLRPLGLPRELILCIRRLGDPLPGTLELWRSRARVPPEWEHAFATRVGELARGAARPIHEVVPPNAEAVLFTNHAELLACLAMDWISGELLNHWWWRGILRDVYQGRVVVNRWLEASGSVPAAVDNLSRRGQLPAFMTALKRSEVRELHRAIIIKFGLHELWPTVEWNFSSEENEEVIPTVSPGVGHSRQAGVSQSRSPTRGIHLEAPWRRVAPEIDSRGIDFVRQLFLGIGLMLHRAPSEVRSASFSREVITWYRESSSGNGFSADTISEVGQGGEGPQPALRNKASTRAAPDSSRQTKHPISTGQSSEGSLVSEQEILPPGESKSKIKSRQPSGSPSTTIAESPMRPSSPSASTLVNVPPLVTSGEEIETELGGLFYLINIAIHLNFYPDFTRPLDPCITLPVWDFIKLVGRRILAGQLRDDPIWRFLARLAGRTEDELPGEYFEAPDEWRIPVEWLKPFAGHSVWMWRAEGKRLRVFHREGFCILDVRTKGNPEKCLLDEIGAYSRAADFVLRRGKRKSVINPQLERWLDWIVPFILARLRLAFGLDRNKDVAGLLLNHRAEVEAGDARLDVYLALADLPIEIRFAGLDRDPGWVPAAGRFVAFHYK